MDDKHDQTVPEAGEADRGEHNQLGYYDADEDRSFDERGSQTEGPGESEGERDEDDE